MCRHSFVSTKCCLVGVFIVLLINSCENMVGRLNKSQRKQNYEIYDTYVFITKFFIVMPS